MNNWYMISMLCRDADQKAARFSLFDVQHAGMLNGIDGNVEVVRHSEHVDAQCRVRAWFVLHHLGFSFPTAIITCRPCDNARLQNAKRPTRVCWWAVRIGRWRSG